jgi:hypothetical protein
MNYTEQEIKNWRRYEEVRSEGLYNMINRDAQEATGLSRGDYFFTLRNYSGLKAAAEAK